MGNDDLWVAGRAPTPALPPRPDESKPSLGSLPLPEAPTSPGKLARFGGGGIVVFAVLSIVGAISDVGKPEYASRIYAYWILILLCVASVIGGCYLFKNGWRDKHHAANVLSLLPGAVLGVLFVLGSVVAVVPEPKADTDAYGYTALDKQSFTQGCGGGAFCECVFSAVERTISHDQFAEEGLTYAQTGSFSPAFTAKLTQVFQTADC